MSLRFRLRTLLILLGVGPPTIAGAWSVRTYYLVARARPAAVRTYIPAGPLVLYRSPPILEAGKGEALGANPAPPAATSIPAR